MMLLIAQLGIALFGAAAFLFVTHESKHWQKIGTILGLISNPFWWLMVFATGQWYTIPVHLLYTYGWMSKAFRLWSKPRTYTVTFKVDDIQRNTVDPTCPDQKPGRYEVEAIADNPWESEPAQKREWTVPGFIGCY
jgi:hypothetical protein